MSGPLDGIRVIELATWHNGAAAGYLLGDLGADVIKIEQPGVGDPTRGLKQAFGHSLQLPGNRALWFDMVNRSKRSITLDLKSEQGREVLHRLVGKADVFFTNFTSDVVDRLGADYESLSAHNPRLIWAINTGVGTKGPQPNTRTFDSSIQARTGYMFRMGNAESGDPLLVGGGTFDQIGATMLVYGIMAALIARERQGIGQAIETSMLGSSIHLQHDNLHLYLWKKDATFGTSSASARDPFINWYRCSDGRWIMLTEPHPDRVWGEFCRVLGLVDIESDPRFTTLEARLRHGRILASLVEEAFARRTRDQWIRLFDEQQVRFIYSAVNTVAEVAEDPQALANDYIVPMEHPTLGSTWTTGVPVKFSKTPSVVGSPAPECGQHTEEVLQEVAGYSWREITRLKEDGVI